MTLLPLNDPRSFGIPLISACAILLILVVLMSTHWMNTERHTVKTVPSHIAARIVQIETPKPKKAKKVQKAKKTPPKKVKKTPAKKAKTLPKPKPKPKVSKPKPAPIDQAALKAKQKALEAARQAAIKEELAKAAAQEQALDELDALLAEEDRFDEALQAEQDQAAIADYASQIRALIERVWRVPPSAKHTDTLLLRLYLVPTGEVTEVQVLESSGNVALDRSAEQAVWKVGTLPVPDDAALFEKQFRRFTLKLTPENARL